MCMRQQRRARKTPLDTLARQERRIVEALIETGPTNQELATRFGISEETVKSHFRHVFNKTGFSTRLELAVNLLHQRYREMQ